MGAQHTVCGCMWPIGTTFSTSLQFLAQSQNKMIVRGVFFCGGVQTCSCSLG